MVVVAQQPRRGDPRGTTTNKTIGTPRPATPDPPTSKRAGRADQVDRTARPDRLTQEEGSLVPRPLPRGTRAAALVLALLRSGLPTIPPHLGIALARDPTDLLATATIAALPTDLEM